MRAALAGTMSVLVLAGVLVTPAGAAPRPAFVLTATGDTPHPVFEARPGTTVSSTVLLTSRSDSMQTIRLQTVDLATSNLGGIEFPSRRPAGPGTWLKLDRRDVRIPPRGTATVRLSVTVPTRTPAGDHYAGVVAVDRKELRRALKAPPKKASGVVLRQLTRVALPVRVRLPGRAVRRLRLRDIAFAADAGGSHLRVRLRNSGQRLLRSTAVDLRIARGDRRLFTVRASLAEVVPATGLAYPVRWRGAPPRSGTYRVTGTISPKGAPRIRVDERVRFGTTQADKVEELTGVPAVGEDGRPWLLLTVAALVLLVAVSASVGYLRLRRRLAEQGAAGPAPSPR